MRIPQFINRLICKLKGHDFYVYGIYDSFGEIVETAGECKRCHFDTHENA